jgi:hypothetical protein
MTGFSLIGGREVRPLEVGGGASPWLDWGLKAGEGPPAVVARLWSSRSGSGITVPAGNLPRARRRARRTARLAFGVRLTNAAVAALIRLSMSSSGVSASNCDVGQDVDVVLDVVLVVRGQVALELDGDRPS